MSMNRIPEPRAGSKPEFLLIRRADLDAITTEIERARELAETRQYGTTATLCAALGRARGLINGIHQDDEPGLSIFDPSEFIPTDDELQWAAENITPCRAPQDIDALLSLIADAMTAVGLDPAISGRSIDVQFSGREYRVPIDDMTAYYDEMDRQYRERTGGLSEDEAAMLAAGHPLG